MNSKAWQSTQGRPAGARAGAGQRGGRVGAATASHRTTRPRPLPTSHRRRGPGAAGGARGPPRNKGEVQPPAPRVGSGPGHPGARHLLCAGTALPAADSARAWAPSSATLSSNSSSSSSRRAQAAMTPEAARARPEAGSGGERVLRRKGRVWGRVPEEMGGTRTRLPRRLARRRRSRRASWATASVWCVRPSLLGHSAFYGSNSIWMRPRIVSTCPISVPSGSPEVCGRERATA